MEVTRCCLVCRKKAQKPELYRFVRAVDGEICFDEKGSLPHRGAWICTSKSCLSKAFMKRLLFKGERTLPVNAEMMLKNIYDRVKRGTLSRLGLMRRLGRVEGGREVVERTVSLGKAKAVIFAKDLSSRSVRELNEKFLGSQSVVLLNSPFFMDEIGQSLGRKKTGVVALLEDRITDEILLQISKLNELDS